MLTANRSAVIRPARRRRNPPLPIRRWDAD